MAMKDDRFTIKIKKKNVPAWRGLQSVTGENLADEVIKKAWQKLKAERSEADIN
jgi:hypothetical protein